MKHRRGLALFICVTAATAVMAQVDRGIELYEAREYDAAIEILERATRSRR